jgi:hypothetical protein
MKEVQKVMAALTLGYGAGTAEGSILGNAEGGD